MKKRTGAAASRVRRRAVAVLAATLLAALTAASSPTRAAELPAGIEGRWVAEGTAPPFAMTFAPTASGFGLRWTVPGEGEAEAEFVPTDRPGVLAAGGERGWSMFGGGKPVDPLVEGTLRWARVASGAVYVYGLSIDDRGAFVLDRYACRPTGDGLEVAFQRRLPEGRVEERKLMLTRPEG